MAVANFSNTKEVKYNVLVKNSSAVAEALYNEKKYVRAMLHYKNAARYKESLGYKEDIGCNVEAISLLYKAYDSALKADIPSEVMLIGAKVNEIISYKICEGNLEAIKFRYWMTLKSD
jgi:hypothetical protein